MEKKQILIVEDESIVAEDIKNSLKNLGYRVNAAVSSGEEAIKKVEEQNPDLVLMDIKIKGDMDGVEAANQMRSRFDIPVVFLTAHADEQTLKRAKTTGPFGYILKPFENRDLQISIEMALYKWRMEKALKEREKWFSTTLWSISDAVITTDIKGFVSFMNPAAEALTGWSQEYAAGKPKKDVLYLVSEETGAQIEGSAADEVAKESLTRATKDAVLMAKDGTKCPIEETESLIKDDKGRIIGNVTVFRDITDRKQAEDALKQDAEELEKANMVMRQALDKLLERVEQSKISQHMELTKVGEDTKAIFLYPLEQEEEARFRFLSRNEAGLPSLAVVRTPPQRFREILGKDVETIWLTNNRETDMVCVSPTNIARLSMVLCEFFDCASGGVILFEGVEYILSIVGFQDMLNLIQLLNDKLALTGGAIYMILDLEVLDEKEARYIQRECLEPPKTDEGVGA